MSLRDQIAEAIAAQRSPSEHSQRCPVWTGREKGTPVARCDCWILSNARRDADTALGAVRSVIGRAEQAGAANERVRVLATEAIKGWEPERDYHQERAERKGYSLNEASAEIYGDAIEVLTEILAVLDQQEAP